MIVPVVSKKGSDDRDNHMETLPRRSQTTRTTETTSIAWIVSKYFETTGAIGTIRTIIMSSLKNIIPSPAAIESHYSIRVQLPRRQHGHTRRINDFVMHLSMLNPRVGGGRATHGKLTECAFPWVGILTFKSCPRVGNLTWPPSWKTERNWK